MSIRPELFGLPFTELTDEEKEILTDVKEALFKGNTLYNKQMPDSTEHVGWAVGLAAAILKESDIEDVAVAFTLHYSKEYGLGISFVVGESSDSE